MTLTTTQERAIIEIKRMESQLEKRWFISAEIPGITENTLKALERKGYLEYTDVDGLSYYKSTW